MAHAGDCWTPSAYTAVTASHVTPVFNDVPSDFYQPFIIHCWNPTTQEFEPTGLYYMRVEGGVLIYCPQGFMPSAALAYLNQYGYSCHTSSWPSQPLPHLPAVDDTDSLCESNSSETNLQINGASACVEDAGNFDTKEYTCITAVTNFPAEYGAFPCIPANNYHGNTMGNFGEDTCGNTVSVDMSSNIEASNSVNAETDNLYEDPSKFKASYFYSATANFDPSHTFNPAVSFKPKHTSNSSVNFDPPCPYNPAVNFDPRNPFSAASNSNPRQIFNPAVSFDQPRIFNPVANFEPIQPVTPTANFEPRQTFNPKMNFEPRHGQNPATNFEPRGLYSSLNFKDNSATNNTEPNKETDTAPNRAISGNINSTSTNPNNGINTLPDDISAKSNNEVNVEVEPCITNKEAAAAAAAATVKTAPGQKNKNKFPGRQNYQLLWKSGGWGRTQTSVPHRPPPTPPPSPAPSPVPASTFESQRGLVSNPSLAASSTTCKKKVRCVFCQKNGEEDVYHIFKDKRGRVLCPVLSSYRCRLCGATGMYAHTLKYCPNNKITRGDPVAAGLPPGLMPANIKLEDLV